MDLVEDRNCSGMEAVRSQVPGVADYWVPDQDEGER